MLSPISCVLPGGQAMKYKHIVTKESHWTDTREKGSLLARRKESPRLLWDALMNQLCQGLGLPSYSVDMLSHQAEVAQLDPEPLDNQ